MASQCIGHLCYRQEHDTDGKIARLFGDCWNAVFGRPFAKGSPYAIGPFSVLPFRLSLTLVYHGQTVGWIKMKRGTEVGLGQGHIVLDGDPSPPKGHNPQFSAHVRCGQTAGCIRMPHGTEVGLGPGYPVLHGNPYIKAPSHGKGTAAPINFSTRV